MTPGARAAAAIEVLADIEARKRPAAEALKDWGIAHRFAGSSDRAAIGNLVFDALRVKSSAAYARGEDSPRALVLRTLAASWHMSPEAIAAIIDGTRHAPPPLPGNCEPVPKKGTDLFSAAPRPENRSVPFLSVFSYLWQ